MSYELIKFGVSISQNTVCFASFINCGTIAHKQNRQTLMLGNISWQGLQDDYQTYCGLISFPDEEGRTDA